MARAGGWCWLSLTIDGGYFAMGGGAGLEWSGGVGRYRYGGGGDAGADAALMLMLVR